MVDPFEVEADQRGEPVGRLDVREDVEPSYAGETGSTEPYQPRIEDVAEGDIPSV